MLDSNRRGFFRALLGIGVMAASAKVVEKIPVATPEIRQGALFWDNGNNAVWTVGYLGPAQTLDLSLTYRGTSYTNFTVTDFTVTTCGSFEVTND